MQTSQPGRDRSFRIVAESSRIPLAEALLEAEGFHFESEPFSPVCRRLLSGPFPLGSSLAAFFGYIYIQNRSSMLPPLALAPEAGSAVLDMAASPGSKSGFLAQLCGRTGLVLANEPNPGRLHTLRANLARANLLQTATCCHAGEKLPLWPGSWSHILLDPPCSGWGTANPRALKLWQGDKIDRLIALQRQLLAKAASLLAPGGRLLYSTCTTNPAENEDQTRYALDRLGLVSVPIQPFPGFAYDETLPGCLLVNGADSGAQGFYLSLLRKPGAAAPPEQATSSPEFTVIPQAALSGPVCDPLQLPEGEVALFGDRAWFLPGLTGASLPRELTWRGFPLGKMGKDGFAPWPRLRTLLPAPDAFPDAPRIIVEEISAIRKLLSGQAESTSLGAQRAGLWWRELPLGICEIRKNRIIARFSA